jgi:transposase
LISLVFASEIGEISRFSSASKLVGYAGLAPRIIQSGDRSATGRLEGGLADASGDAAGLTRDVDQRERSALIRPLLLADQFEQ